MSRAAIRPAVSEIPPEVWQRISGFTKSETASAVAAAYNLANACEGLAILLNPSVRVAASVALGMQNSGATQAGMRTYILDARREHLSVLIRELARERLANEVTLYHGSPIEFFRDLPLLPSFIYVGENASSGDVIALCRHAPAGSPILFQSADAGELAASAGQCVARGLIVPDATEVPLYRSVNANSPNGVVPSRDARVMLQGALHDRYFHSAADAPGSHTSVGDLTEQIRTEFSIQFPFVSGYGDWPYVKPDSNQLPSNLPNEKQWPKISIVTPSFNQALYIEETILSILNQGYPNFEHIIIDGGSTDDTLRILEKYRGRIAYAVSEPDNGQSHAINKGMALATGEILTWLNGDDRLAPGALAAIALAFATSGADMVAGICRLYRDGECIKQHLTSCAEGPLPLEILLDLDHGWNAGQFFFQPEVMFTRKLWLRAGGHVNDWLHYSMDYELWLRFAEAGARLHVIGRPVAWFRLHDQQKTHAKEQFQAELIVVRDSFLKTRELPLAVSANPAPRRTSLRVTFLNDHGAFFGAGIAHVRLARAVARVGHTVTLVSIIDRPKFDMETPNYTVESVLSRIAETKPDLVVVGNLHNASAEPLLLNFLCERYPTLAIMHDFWILTGRCAYTDGCEKYLTGCDETCPTPTEYPALAPSEIADAWKKKRLLLQADNRPVLLANSSWVEGFTKDTLRVASLDGGRGPAVDRVHLSFPLDIFRPRDRRSCREVFHLPDDAFIVLLPASLEDPRKGARRFLDALGKLQTPNLLVVTVGPISPNLESPVRVVQLGYITDPHRIAQLNSAADLVAVPSSAETFGQTCIESIACGTPVVGYPVTGVREALCDGITGLLAADTNPVSLAAVVHHLYCRPDVRRDLAAWGRIYVENEWSEYAAYRYLFQAWQATGLAARLDLQPNIGFQPKDPAVPPVLSVWRNRAPWVAGRGISWQAKAPEHGLDAFWWVYGPSAIAEVLGETTGLHHLLISYRNPQGLPRLTLRCNGMVLGTFEILRTGYGNGRLLVADARLEAGPNILHFDFMGYPEHDPKSAAMILTEILVERAAASRRDELYGDTIPEEVLNRVWGQLER